MWMLLEQVTQSEAEDLNEVIVSWSDMVTDIPQGWKDLVHRCLDPDPNERIGLSALVDFWASSTVQRLSMFTLHPDLPISLARIL